LARHGEPALTRLRYREVRGTELTFITLLGYMRSVGIKAIRDLSFGQSLGGCATERRGNDVATALLRLFYSA
jgi:hypothetical protein